MSSGRAVKGIPVTSKKDHGHERSLWQRPTEPEPSYSALDNVALFQGLNQGRLKAILSVPIAAIHHQASGGV